MGTSVAWVRASLLFPQRRGPSVLWVESKVWHTEQDMLTPDQLRAARALVKWSREDLAEKASVAAVTIKGFELLGADSKISTLNARTGPLRALIPV